MIVKDWAQEAAKELASYFSFGPGRDSYVTDEQRQRVADSYRTIILKHCPMLPDTAYMPVPRCETCKHWDLDTVTSVNTAECTLPTMVARVMYDGGEKINFRMRTQHDFGCVRWEAK
jgi:hypothetical protein